MYSNKEIQNRPEHFPPPMNWLVWIEGWEQVTSVTSKVAVSLTSGGVTLTCTVDLASQSPTCG